MISDTIFRHYDIRGRFGADLSGELAYLIGKAFTNLNITNSNNIIIVGRDGRTSSPILFDYLVSGIISAGGHVVDIDIVPTPMLYFADKKFMPAASIMITGSHNPAQDNGFKMVAGGKPFFGEQIQTLKNLVKTLEITKYGLSQPTGTADIYESYIDRIIDNLSINQDLKVVWDSGNGAGGKALEKLMQKLPNHNILINKEIDGTFPNHPPDPTRPENLQQLINVIHSENADLGIALDGDADRIVVVDSRGNIILGDQLLCIFSNLILKENPGATIISDVKASQILFDYIRKNGGIPLMWKCGHSSIKTKIIETGALLAGEMSGHIFFADKYYGYDDAIYAALRLLDLLTHLNTKLDILYDQLPKAFNTPEIRIDVDEEIKFNIIEKIKTLLVKHNTPFNDIDGVRVSNDKGWWLARASNTQAALIVRCEAYRSEDLDVISAELNNILQHFGLKI